MKLYNFETERDEEIPSELAQRLILSGSHGPYEQDEVPIVSPRGDIEILKGADVGKALQNGWKLPDEKISTTTKEAKLYDAMDGEAAAAAVARGITMGISDQALVNVFGADPEHLRKLKEYNPYLSPIAEGVGVLGSLLVAPEALVAKGLTKAGMAAPGVVSAVKTASKFIPTKLANKANLAVENVVGRAMVKAGGITETSNAMAKAAATYLPKGVGSAVEGAMYGTGQLVSEHALGEAELSGENLFASAKEGAMWGGALGVIIPGAFDAAVKTMIAGPKLVEKTAKLFGRYARIDDNKVEDYLKKPFDIPRDRAGNPIDKTAFAEDLALTSEKFRKQVEAGEIEVQEAENLLKGYEIAYASNSEIAKDNFQNARNKLKEKIKQRQDDIKSNPIDPDMVLAVKNTFKAGEDYRNQLSKESYDILDNAPLSYLERNAATGKMESRPTYIRAFDVINYLKTDAIKNVTKGKDGLPVPKGEAEKNFLNLVRNRIDIFKDFRKNVSQNIHAPEIKSFIQQIDNDIEKYGGWWQQTPEINFLKDLRSYLDNRVKEAVPEYQTKMLAVKEMTDLLTSIKKQYGKSVKQLNSDIETMYFDDSAIKDRIIRIARDGKNADGLLKAIRDVQGYLPQEMKPTFNIEAGLRNLKAQYGFAYGKGDEYLLRLEAQKLVDPELKNLSLMQKELRDQSEEYERGKNFLKRTTSQVLSDEVIPRLDSLKRVMDQREKYKGLLQKLYKAEEEYKIWKDVTTTEDALNKISQWESIGKKERLVSTLNKKHQSLKRLLGDMADLPENDLIDIVNTLRIEAAFDKTATNGSRNANAWSIVIGAATGGAVSGLSPLGMALGVGVGLFMDAYSPRIAKSVLKSMSKLQGAITPTKLNQILVNAVPKMDGDFQKTAFNTLKHIESNNKNFSDQVRHATSNYFKKPLGAIRIAATKAGIEYFDEHRDRLKQIQDQRGIVNNEFFSTNEMISAVAPSTTQSYLATYNRAVDFLQTKFPTIGEDDLNNFEPTNLEKIKFNKYMQYVEDPSLVMKEIAGGTIPADGVEVLKNVYPSMFNVIRSQMQNEIMNMNPKEIPLNKKNEISRMFGLELARTYYPTTFNILQNQSNSQQKEDAQPNQINLKSKAGQRATTSMERITNRV